MRRGACRTKNWGRGSVGRSAGGRGRSPKLERAPRRLPGGAGELSVQRCAGLAHRGGRHSRSPGEAGSAGGRRLVGHRLPDAGEADPRANASPPQRGGEVHSPSSCRRQGEPWTLALALPEAAKLWARPGWLAVSSRFASGTGQVAGVWGGGSGQLRSSHLVASEWGPGSGRDGSWVTPSPAIPPSPPGGGALATPLSIVRVPPPFLSFSPSPLKRPA